jgi:hypothetical protein
MGAFYGSDQRYGPLLNQRLEVDIVNGGERQVEQVAGQRGYRGEVPVEEYGVQYCCSEISPRLQVVVRAEGKRMVGVELFNFRGEQVRGRTFDHILHTRQVCKDVQVILWPSAGLHASICGLGMGIVAVRRPRCAPRGVFARAVSRHWRLQFGSECWLVCCSQGSVVRVYGASVVLSWVQVRRGRERGCGGGAVFADEGPSLRIKMTRDDRRRHASEIIKETATHHPHTHSRFFSLS